MGYRPAAFASLLLLSCWGPGPDASPPLSNPDSLPNRIGMESLADSVHHPQPDTTPHPDWILFRARYRFATFPVTVQKQDLAAPDFATVDYGSDPKFREHVRKRLDSVNFAGHYSIVSLACGAMCEDFHLIDRRTGKIFDPFPQFGEGKWGFRFRPDSRLLIANAELIGNDTLSRYSPNWNLKPELYEWTGTAFRRLQ